MGQSGKACSPVDHDQLNIILLRKNAPSQIRKLVDGFSFFSGYKTGLFITSSIRVVTTGKRKNVFEMTSLTCAFRGAETEERALKIITTFFSRISSFQIQQNFNALAAEPMQTQCSLTFSFESIAALYWLPFESSTTSHWLSF